MLLGRFSREASDSGTSTCSFSLLHNPHISLSCAVPCCNTEHRRFAGSSRPCDSSYSFGTSRCFGKAGDEAGSVPMEAILQLVIILGLSCPVWFLK